MPSVARFAMVEREYSLQGEGGVHVVFWFHVSMARCDARTHVIYMLKKDGNAHVGWIGQRWTRSKTFANIMVHRPSISN
eukprot:scaffold5_cov331-Pavlova_lutheri.AAC.16